MSVRLLGVGDLSAITAVQRECYRDELIENEITFRKKIEGFPRGCLGLDRDGRIGGYVFCQPWRFGEVVPLDDSAGTVPPGSDCLYIHDLSVIPAWRGTGAAKELLDGVFGLAAETGLSRFGLVAVQASEPFWERWGFRVARTFQYTAGVPASYMTKENR
jgi:GNAT superfamily N-acetyltransferase